MQTRDSSGAYKEFRKAYNDGTFSSWAAADIGGNFPNGETIDSIEIGAQNGSATYHRYYDELRSDVANIDSTQFTSIISPVQGSTLTNNDVLFSFSYFYADTASSTPYDTVAVSIQDNTISQTIQGPSQLITSTGGANFSKDLILADNHLYTWTPFFLNSSTGAILNGPATGFFINTTGQTDTIATLPTGLQQIWNAVQNNPPFGFIFQVRNQINGLTATGTPAVSLYIMDFERNYVLTPLDTAIASILWLFFLIWLYYRAKHFEF
jgi:hypothetical protein